MPHKLQTSIWSEATGDQTRFANPVCNASTQSPAAYSYTYRDRHAQLGTDALKGALTFFNSLSLGIAALSLPAVIVMCCSIGSCWLRDLYEMLIKIAILGLTMSKHNVGVSKSKVGAVLVPQC